MRGAGVFVCVMNVSLFLISTRFVHGVPAAWAWHGCFRRVARSSYGFNLFLLMLIAIVVCCSDPGRMERGHLRDQRLARVEKPSRCITSADCRPYDAISRRRRSTSAQDDGGRSPTKSCPAAFAR